MSPLRGLVRIVRRSSGLRHWLNYAAPAGAERRQTDGNRFGIQIDRSKRLAVAHQAPPDRAQWRPIRCVLNGGGLRPDLVRTTEEVPGNPNGARFDSPGRLNRPNLGTIDFSQTEKPQRGEIPIPGTAMPSTRWYDDHHRIRGRTRRSSANNSRAMPSP